jgi:molybdopterin-synthase adenylyltransferase
MSPEASSDLAERRRARYLRHERAAGIDADALAAAALIVVGAGAVGNEVIKCAALLGVGRITVVDFDRVEAHNLTRSIFLREADIGRSKAQAVVARAAEVDPFVRLEVIDGDAWRNLRLTDVAACTAVIACVDNIETRQRLSQLCRLAGTRWVNLGIDSRFASIESHPFGATGEPGGGDPAAEPACYECQLPDSAYAQVASRYSCGWLRRALHAERTVPTTALTASLAGALGVQAALGLGAVASGTRVIQATRILVDSRTGTSTVSTLDRHAGCPACGDDARPPHRAPHRMPLGADWRADLIRLAAPDDGLQLSDALILAAHCVHCGHTPELTAVIGQRASDHDDRLLRCGRCQDLSVRLDLRAELTVADLLAHYPASRPPIKFALRRGAEQTLCLDFEPDAT